MSPSFEYVFPAIRGLQASKPFFVSMCPLRLIPKIFIFDEEEVSPELRAQRTLNRQRIPDIANYIVEHHDSYVFSAITASIDAPVTFEPLSQDPMGQNIGRLHVPMSARFLINDGQHRRAAIEVALKERPELGDETIAVVFFLDPDLDRCQQMFSDLNRYAVRPSPSLSILYDQRDEGAVIAKEVVRRAAIFRGTVEMEKSTLALRSGKLFTLSAVTKACESLLADQGELDLEGRAQLGADFWDAVAAHMPEWRMVRDRKLSAGEVRRDFICAHALVLAALGMAGRSLLADDPQAWRARLAGLDGVDWGRSNAELWEGRALQAGRVSKSRTNVALTTAAIKGLLALPLSPDERRLEQQLTHREPAHV